MFRLAIAVLLAPLALSVPTENMNIDFSGINLFTLSLLDNTYAYQEDFGSKNIALSPLSVWGIFSLLAEGSIGATFEELVTTLRLPNDLTATQMLHKAVDDVLKTKDKDVYLRRTNAMIVDKSLTIYQEFCRSVQLHKTRILSVDTTNVTLLVTELNELICRLTGGHIQDPIKASFVENLRMILIDVLYFKASWTYPFDKTQTKEEMFYNHQGKTIGYVNMMYHKAPHNLGYSNLIGAEVLEMTYGKHGDYAMLILLPYDGIPVKKLLNNLATQNLDWMMEFKTVGHLPTIDCYIPRFTINSNVNLIPPLQYTGIHTIFDSNAARLPGISKQRLFVTQAMQNVKIEVTESGTVAAAATVVGLEDRILGQRFEANKEFVYLITERSSNVILFAGVYAEPTVV